MKPLFEPSQTPRDLIRAWILRALVAQEAHAKMAHRLMVEHKVLGVVVVATTTVVGAEVFSDLGKDNKLFLGLMSLLAAVLSSLQTFLKFGEQAQQHHSAAARYCKIRRTLEVLHTRDSHSQNELDALQAQMDKLNEDSPDLPLRLFRKLSSLHEEQEPRVVITTAACPFEGRTENGREQTACAAGMNI